jgi:chromosome segregation ATPase
MYASKKNLELLSKEFEILEKQLDSLDKVNLELVKNYELKLETAYKTNRELQKSRDRLKAKIKDDKKRNRGKFFKGLLHGVVVGGFIGYGLSR